jgi:hypothetical protein
LPKANPKVGKAINSFGPTCKNRRPVQQQAAGLRTEAGRGGVTEIKEVRGCTWGAKLMAMARWSAASRLRSQGEVQAHVGEVGPRGQSMGPKALAPGKQGNQSSSTPPTNKHKAKPLPAENSHRCTSANLIKLQLQFYMRQTSRNLEPAHLINASSHPSWAGVTTRKPSGAEQIESADDMSG